MVTTPSFVSNIFGATARQFSTFGVAVPACLYREGLI